MSTIRPRVLLIGCGNIAGRFDMARPADAWPMTQAGAFRRHGGYELAACIDPDEQARLAFAAHWDIPRHAPSLEALGALPGEFDVIGLCSPTALHHTHLASVLPLKPRVIFCEKPLTQGLRESAHWVQACAEQGINLVVNYTRQWDPSVEKLVEEVRSGCWGTVRSAVGYYNKGVLNNGGHLVDLLLRLLGPLEVIAAATPVHDHWDNDPTVSGLLRSMEGQVPVCLAPAHAKDYALFELELVCELGVLRMRNGGMQWETLHAEASPHFSGYRALTAVQASEGNYLQAMTLAVTEIHQHLSHGTATRSAGDHALAIQAICEQLLAAATHAPLQPTEKTMSNSKLALFGGSPVIPAPLQGFHSIGEDEVAAASEVIRGGVLSAYIGAPGPGFMGGPKVQQFEAQAAAYFGVKHAIAVNSWTSGLIAAVGAIGLEPGDEIITTPWTMAATATAILHWNGIPVFADIDSETFNICPKSVDKLVTKRTKAIFAVDIFGQSADIPALREIADRHGLKLLCDTAQAPGAKVGERFTGTFADIGGFSLNYHKHIHCGEGGVLVTNDDRLAHRLCLIRNHAEAVVRTNDVEELSNMLGYNFRMGEIEAAIASVQLTKLAPRVQSRQRIAAELNEGLGGLRGVTTPKVNPGATHVYYVYGLTLDVNAIGVSRARLVEALRAEGVPALMEGYQNLHLLPMFRHKIAYGTKGFPWNSPYCVSDIQYGPGLCPVAEKLHSETFLGLNICMNELPPADVVLIIAAFHKVWSQMDKIKGDV